VSENGLLLLLRLLNCDTLRLHFRTRRRLQELAHAMVAPATPPGIKVAAAQNPEEDRMSKEDVQTVTGAYDAFNSGDIDSVLAALDDNVEWYEPGGGNAPSGTFKGHQSVASDVFASVAANFDEFRAEPDQFIDAGEYVVAVGRFRGRSKGGKELDAAFVHVAKMRSGKEVEFFNHVSADEWADAWSS
jgi:hypothetical protein